ncbi:N-terminal double-transmembrane domain-containing protein [Spirosomataceae bacterium TFI 002]|nr:N-terminal double-transmembrane domain-containing protein [Spirosomataceae bacterium TFI 002]
MKFLFPSILWALGALAIPLIVHLFNFRRTKKIFFTNVAFLQKVETETSSFRKLKQWLIMAARMLALACLVFAFAQPFLPAANQSSLSVNGVNSIYLDNSLSMENTTDNKRYIDLAVVKLEGLLEQLKNSPNLQFLTNDFGGEDYMLNSGTSLKEKLTSLEFGNTPRSLSAVYKRQSNLAQKQDSEAGNNFFWISDFQKSTIGNLKDIEFDSTNTVYVVPVIGAVNQNVYVDSVWLQTPFIREMQNNNLNVAFRNSGNKDVVNLPVKLQIDGSQSSGSSVSIPAGGSAKATFSFSVQDKGQHKAEISFDDQPLTFDNSYFFTIEASPAIKVLHLYDERSELDYIGKLYKNDSLFAFQSYNVNNVDVSRMADFDLVILEGIRNYRTNLVNGAKELVASGGSVSLIPTAQGDSSSTASLLSNFGIRVSKIDRSKLDPTSQRKVKYPDVRNPFFSDVFEQINIPNNVELPAMQPVLAWEGIGEPLLYFSNDQRFMTHTQTGRGSVYVFASPLLKGHGNFAEHAFFVPTFIKIASNSLKSSALAYKLSEENIVLELSDLKKNATYKLVKDGNEILPIQRVVDNKLFLTLPSNSDLPENSEIAAGYYDLVFDGKVLHTLALNHDPKESQMDFYTSEELREAFAGNENVQVFDGLLESDFVKSFTDQNIGKSLWVYFLIGALLFLLAEMLLVRFMKG